MRDLFKNLNKQIKNLKKDLPCFEIGKTYLKKSIVCFKLGQDKKKKSIFLQGGIHAREYITCFYLLKLLNYLKHFVFNGQIYIVPISNPDGIDVAINGLKNIKSKKIKMFLNNLVKSKSKLKMFKANINGVDLNTNFDACWGKGKQNIFKPSSQNFVGYKPNSENEVLALINITKKIKPNLTLSYHSKGEVVYYGFANQNKKKLKQQKRYLKIIKSETNYKPIFTKNSCGGYKDYCILKLDILGFTIEVGSDKFLHPISLSNLDKIFEENKDLPLMLLKSVF